mmetsp:Transcript_1712/g.4013  ORF Transcript_1712/g.4013 Transcript_1712/m.4013 type:complete len:206 (-) Transcript_1712:280-897(-)
MCASTRRRRRKRNSPSSPTSPRAVPTRLARSSMRSTSSATTPKIRSCAVALGARTAEARAAFPGTSTQARAAVPGAQRGREVASVEDTAALALARTRPASWAATWVATWAATIGHRPQATWGEHPPGQEAMTVAALVGTMMIAGAAAAVGAIVNARGAATGGKAVRAVQACQVLNSTSRTCRGTSHEMRWSMSSGLTAAWWMSTS